MNEFELTGQVRSHIIELHQPKCTLHHEAVHSFMVMHQAACREGIQLHVRSAFRSFETQLSIWNAKWRGERPLLTRDGHVLNHAELTPTQRLDAILIWSALPGGSRHHWGSDIDLIDAQAIPTGYQVQLIPDEYAANGIFSNMSRWLERHAATYGFFRPYRTDRGGVSPEPWHYSYAPIALKALESLNVAMLQRAIEASDIEGKSLILEHLPQIYRRYVLAVDTP